MLALPNLISLKMGRVFSFPHPLPRMSSPLPSSLSTFPQERIFYLSFLFQTASCHIWLKNRAIVSGEMGGREGEKWEFCSSSRIWSFWRARTLWGFPGKESTCPCRRRTLDLWSGNIPWRRKRHPTPVFLPGESHGQICLESYGPLGPRVIHDLATAQGRRRSFVTERVIIAAATVCLFVTFK